MKTEQFNRRKFLEFIGKGALVIGATAHGLSLNGCSKKPDSPKTINVNGVEYQIKEGVISQALKGNGQIKLGVMTDIHAHEKNSQYFAEQLNKEGVNVYFLGGDLSHSFGDYEGAKDDYKEIISVVEPVADTGKLVLVTNGNHEQRKAYRKALDNLTLKYANVIDLENVPVADLDGLTIVALGGNDNPRFNVPEGYLRTIEDFKRLGELIKQYQSDKPLLIATHIPKRYSTSRGLDVIDGGYNVGGVELTRIRKFVDSNAVCGHIHESFGIITLEEEPVKEGELVDRLDFSPGAVWDHLQRKNLRPAAGILEFIGNKARAYILNR